MQKTLTTTIVLSIIAGTWFTSPLFYDALNDIKNYSVVILVLLSLIICLLHIKNLRLYTEIISSNCFCCCITIISTSLAVHGLLQYFHLLQSNNAFFDVTGSFENPAGYAIASSIYYPFTLYTALRLASSNTTKFVCFLSVAIQIAGIIASNSRCGMISYTATSLIVIFSLSSVNKYVNKYKFITICIGVSLCFVCIIALYQFKQESAEGRWLVWKICYNIIAEKPWFGYGANGFSANYMNAQANYLCTTTNVHELVLADNITHPYNEFIKFAINYGLVTTLILLASIIWGIKIVLTNYRAQRGLFLSIIINIIVFCCFSYPFNYAITWNMSVLILIAIVLSNTIIVDLMSRKIVRRFLSTCFIIILMATLHNGYVNMKWTAISQLSLEGKTEQMLPKYKKLKTYMEDNSMFMYNYAAELNYVGKHFESLEITKDLMNNYIDYDVQILLADNLENTCKYKEAIDAYNHALNMIPKKFAPYDYLLTIYQKQGDYIKTDSIARIILSKEVKIPSQYIKATKERAKRILKKRQHRTNISKY